VNKSRSRALSGVPSCRVNWRDDRGVANGIESLFAAVFLIALFLFFCQVVVWWHAKNILEQAAAEGARVAAAANGSCSDASPAAVTLASRIAGGWVRSMVVDCGGGAREGDIVSVTVRADTPAFFLPGSLSVSARATAPEEAP
jgi:hypothetical protein